ncbi:hypothetical protein U9M48_000836 [Paspalum notatum var. saurae]|uniref:Reverse transcriptase domain-containing protein n=1 Tax=Paspalum notatum var. saurae TaxID=547442 RepID=A0AAQ3SCK5_PASNO
MVDVIFVTPTNPSNNYSLIVMWQVIFRATYWARQWSVLQSVAKRQLIKSACHKLESLAMEIFANQIRGVIKHLVDDGLSILQYADDTVIFLDHDLEQAKNLKLLLCVFEQLSGLKINFHKSELFYFGQAKQEEELYSMMFGCKLGSLPFRYLGIPMHYRRLCNKDWKAVEPRIINMG